MLPRMKHFHFVMTLVLLWAGAALAGCAVYKPLRIEPIAAPSALIQPDFTISHYTEDRDHNLYFVLSHLTTDQATRQTVGTAVVIRMFWQPVGGRTSLNPTSVNATFRYVVLTPGAAGMYEGAGFVRIYSTPGSDTMLACIVDGDLRLAEATKDFHDDLGRASFTGNFAAVLDLDTTDRRATIQRAFFQRSLDVAAGRVPQTAPAATTPAAR